MIDFDIFQTVGPKDFEIINDTLKINKKNVIGYKQIHLFNETKILILKESKMLRSQYFHSHLNI